jgi:hypothetical protein
MTISAETFRRVEYTGSGSTGPFSITFSIDDDDELTVVKTLISTGVSTTLVKTTDYTVAADLTTITLVASISSLYRLTILGNTPMTQEIEYIDFTKMPAENTEDGLDKLTKIVIEQQEVLARAVVLSPGSTVENITIPDPDAGLFLRWNSGETALENYDVIPAGSTTQIQYNNAGVFAGDSGFTTNGAGSVNIVGDLDVDNININGNTIISSNANGSINITPNGTGDVVLDGIKWPQADGTASYFLKTDGAAQTSWGAVYYPGGTDVPISDGGTGASTAAAARAALGLEIGVNVQAYSGNLTALVNLAGASDNLIYFSSPTGLDIAPLTSYARTLIDDVDASTARTTLGLGTIATQASSSVSITGGSIAGITDLAVADGGTGASTAADARTNLGLVIGTNVQAYDAQLADIAGLTPTDNGVVIGNGANFVVESGATLKTSLGLTIGTDVQAYSASLADLANRWTPTSGSGASSLVFYEDTDNGADFITLSAPASLAASYNFVLPVDDGTADYVLKTDGSGNTSWTAMSAGVADGDKGDITVSASGATWTIDAGAVTLAKMADIATDSFLGRDTAGTGAPEVLSVSTVKTLLNLAGTNSGDQTITLTGDVTGSGTGSFAATIANDAVTYAKMQNVSATDKLLGRSTAGAGDVEEITCTAAGRALLDDANASAQRTTLGLEIGTHVQPFSQTLANLELVYSSATVGVPAQLTLWDGGTHYMSLSAATTITSNYTFTFPTSAGTSGYVLSTNGSGVTSWIAMSAGVADGDKGDITVSASGATWTIDNAAVTYAKIQDVSATDKILGRSTAGSGDIEEITCTAAGRALLDDADASAQRTTLGLAIGTDVQAYSADLTDLVTQWTPASAAGAASLIFLEDTDNGTDKVTLAGPASVATSYTFTLPSTAGTANYVLKTDGSGTTSWAAQSGGSTNLGITTLIAKGLF